MGARRTPSPPRRSTHVRRHLPPVDPQVVEESAKSKDTDRSTLAGEDAMSTDSHIEVVLDYFDGCNTGDLDHLLRTLDDDVVHYFLPALHPPIHGATHLAGPRQNPRDAQEAVVHRAAATGALCRFTTGSVRVGDLKLSAAEVRPGLQMVSIDRRERVASAIFPM